MSTAQWMSLIRAILLLLSGVLIQKGFITQTQLNGLEDQIEQAMPAILAFVTAAVPIVTTIWGIVAHSMKHKIKDVAEAPGVEKIVVSRDADPEHAAVQLAKDPTIPKVEFAKTADKP